MKVVIAEKISAAGVSTFCEHKDWRIVMPEEFAAAPGEQLHDADALIVRSAVQANRSLIETAPRLRVIGRAGVGVDNVDVEAATERGIVVMNTPGANAVAVAEHTLGLMLALARHIPRADQTTRAGKWEKKTLQGTELRGKQLGIVGLGRIGMEVGKRALAMGMTVQAYDPYVAESAARTVNISLKPLAELFATSDYVSLHLGLTPETQRLVREESLRKMKRGVRIVNCARGELVDDAALLAALESGQVAGAALDVFTEEPPKNNPLLQHANVIATPHIAGSTNEAQEAVGVQIAQQVCEYLLQSVAQNAVNVPSLSDLEYRRLKPYLHLTERLSRLLAFLIDGNLQDVQIALSEPLKDLNAKLLRSAAVMGVLQGRSQDAINVVNADAIARQRGVAVNVIPLPEALADDHVVSVRLGSSKRSVKALGTVVRGSQARIIGLDGCEIDSPLEGCLLVVRNEDKPGVIGSLGTVLGQHGINIAHFSLGRRADVAVGVVQSDAPVGVNAMAAVRRIPHILEAHTLTF